MDNAATRRLGVTVNRFARNGGVPGSARSTLPALVLIGLLWSLGGTAHGAALYRYINDKGYQEIGYSIPNHLVPNGYDVIDESGRLVRRVGAQLSEEEYAAKMERERKLEACQKAMERVHRRYEVLTDIDAAERQFEQQLTASVKNDKANLDYSRTKLSNQQEMAADMERKGTAIPRDILDNMIQTEQQIQTLTNQLASREQSAVTKAQAFDEERRVFQLSDCNTEQLASVQ